MGFRINTNIASLNAQRNANQTNLGLDKSLQSLSSGLRINTAADDASGLTIADSLRSQANGLDQAIRNANDGIGVVQTADGALDEYTNIVDTIRTKSIQAASDGQNSDSRAAIQRDINRLLEEAQNIATTTSFNGQQLLNGDFSNKNFQIGAYSNETVNISISDTRTTTVGQFANGTGTTVTGTALVGGALLVNGADTGVSTDSSASSKASAINAQEPNTGVKATASTSVLGAGAIGGGSLQAGDVFINGIDLGAVTFSASDATGSLTTAINSIEDQTGVRASLENGALKLTSTTGANIAIDSDGASTDTVAGAVVAAGDLTALGQTNTSVNGAVAAAAVVINRGSIELESDGVINLTGTAEADAGFTDNQTISLANSISSVDVTTYDGAQFGIRQADHALAQLDRTRSDIGSVQNQLDSTIRNISVTQVNVKAAESQIRDVDFAAESANFAKLNILAQSGSYALSQANAVQQNVLRLLQ